MVSTDQRSYVGFADDASVEGGVAEGLITFQRHSLHFASAAGAREVPLVRIEITSDKASGRIFFQDTAPSGECIWTDDVSVLDSPALLSLANTRNQVENLRSASELKRRLTITAYFVGGFALLALVVSILLGMMTRALVARIPPEVEQEIGEALLEDLKAEHTFVEDTNLHARIERAAAPLVATLPPSPTPFKFYLMMEGSPNAVAFPGGNVVVTTGLLETLQDPDEISAVLAHEFAHVRLRHGFRKLISSAGPYLVFMLCMGGNNGLAGFLGGSSGLLIGQGFSQEYELEADAMGWKYLADAQVDPRSLATSLAKIEKASMKPGLKAGFGAFSSHPATSKRIRKLEAKWRKLKDKSPFEQRKGSA